VLRGNPAGTVDAAWRPFISTDASNSAVAGVDGGVFVPVGAGGSPLPPGGTVCEFLGNSSPGVPAWVSPRLVPYSEFTVLPFSTISISWNVPADGAFHTGRTGDPFSYTNTEDCILLVMCQAQIFIEAFALADGPNIPGVSSPYNRYQHDASLEVDRTVAEPVAIASNAGTTYRTMGVIASQGSGGDADAPIGAFSEVTVWCRLFPGDTATFNLSGSAKNTLGMSSGAGAAPDNKPFYAEINNYTIQTWKTGTD
jgi:hypothetical protein